MTEMMTVEESRFISAMVKAGRELSDDDLYAVNAMQSLAIIAARYGPVMTEEHLSWVIAAGAMLERRAREEMKAEIMTKMAFAKAGKGEG